MFLFVRGGAYLIYKIKGISQTEEAVFVLDSFAAGLLMFVLYIVYFAVYWITLGSLPWEIVYNIHYIILLLTTGYLMLFSFSVRAIKNNFQ